MFTLPHEVVCKISQSQQGHGSKDGNTGTGANNNVRIPWVPKADEPQKAWGFWKSRNSLESFRLNRVTSRVLFYVSLWSWLGVVDDSSAASVSVGGDEAVSVVMLLVSLLATVASAVEQPSLSRGAILFAVGFLALGTSNHHSRFAGQLSIYTTAVFIVLLCALGRDSTVRVNERPLVGASLVRVGARVVRRCLVGPDSVVDYMVSESGGTFEAVGLAVSSTAVTLALAFGGSCVAVSGIFVSFYKRPNLLSVAAATFSAGLLATTHMMYFASAYLGSLFDEDVACSGGTSSCGVAIASRMFFVASNDPIVLFASVGALVLLVPSRNEDHRERMARFFSSGESISQVLSISVVVVFLVNFLLSGLDVTFVLVAELSLRCCATAAAACGERPLALAIQLCSYAPYIVDDSFDSAYMTHHFVVWSGSICLVAFVSNLVNTTSYRFDKLFFPALDTLERVSLVCFFSVELLLFVATCTSFSCYNGNLFGTSPALAVQFVSHHFVSVLTSFLLIRRTYTPSSWSMSFVLFSVDVSAASLVYFAVPCIAFAVYMASGRSEQSYDVVDPVCAGVAGVSGLAVFAAAFFVL